MSDARLPKTYESVANTEDRPIVVSHGNDESPRILHRLRPFVLPTLAVCWVAYATSSVLTESGGGIDYLGLTLGVGLMVAGAVQFLRPRKSSEDDYESPESDSDSPECDQSSSPTAEDDA